ncbi:MAG: selenocysteine-specific translation elongation factor [Candidatus Cloacimonetes bacterium]|nr:selenocysteine-specific translation elongation factor [Candidatus Cloacimonadota bacterium]
MNFKHFILGTAGHVDHGKTSLIKTLTGFDCDTHKEEKLRGITINLGFTHIKLPDGNSLSIVDVPGHADFIDTMISGASGIDFVLFVIAADEGIMPQSKEHLEILQLLGIKKGIIVLSKSDLTDKEFRSLVKEDIAIFTSDTFLENCPIVEFSAVTGEGKESLISEIVKLTQTIPEKNSEGHFRMNIDRIFVSQGHGTIVNGSVLSGSADKSKELFLLPGGEKFRIRRIERHGKEVENILAGDRASINLVGLKREEIEKGMILSEKDIRTTRLIDAKISLFKNLTALPLWSQVIVIIGTNRLIAKVHILDDDEIKSGENGLAQIYFNKPIIALPGDCFIIRSSSDDITYGGGHVLDPYPLHHRRRRKKQVELVKQRASGDFIDLIAVEVRKNITPLTFNEIKERNIFNNDFSEDLISKLPEDISCIRFENTYIFLKKEKYLSICQEVIKTLEAKHENAKESDEGKTFLELSGIFGKDQSENNKILLKRVLSDLLDSKKLKMVNNTYALYSHKASLEDKQQQLINAVSKIILNEGKLITKEKVIEAGINQKILRKDIEFAINYLFKNHGIYFSNNTIIHIDIIKKSISIVEKFAKNGIAVTQFRDNMGINRDNSVIILEFLDSLKITTRKDNLRFLLPGYTEKIK